MRLLTCTSNKNIFGADKECDILSNLSPVGLDDCQPQALSIYII